MKEREEYNFLRIDPSASDWALMETAYDATVFHCRKWNDYIRQMGESVLVLEVLEGGRVIGHFVGAFRRVLFLKLVMAPSMGTGTYAQGLCMQIPVTKETRLDIYRQLVQWLFRSRQADYVQICDWQLRTEFVGEPEEWSDPDLEALGIYYNRRYTYCLDIRKPIDELWSNLHYKSCKYSINKARKQGLSVKTVEKEEEIEPFVDQHLLHIQDLLDRKKNLGLPCQSRKNISALCHALFPDRILMMEVLGQNEAGERISMASGIFANGSAGSTFFTGASYHDYMSYCPNELMVWEAIQALHEREAGSFIFGGTASYKKKFAPAYACVPVMIFSRFSLLLGVRRLLKIGYEKALSILWHLKRK